MSHLHIDVHHAMRLAVQTASGSPDPSTQVGAAIYSFDGALLTVGCNTWPHGVEQTHERLQRPLKYEVIEHAERNAIYRAALSGFSTSQGTMVANWAACSDCARAIIQSGIKTLITHSFYQQTSESNGDRRNWGETISVAYQMLEEAGVDVKFVDFPVMEEGDPSLRFNGEYVRF